MSLVRRKVNDSRRSAYGKVGYESPYTIIADGTFLTKSCELDIDTNSIVKYLGHNAKGKVMITNCMETILLRSPKTSAKVTHLVHQLPKYKCLHTKELGITTGPEKQHGETNEQSPKVFHAAMSARRCLYNVLRRVNEKDSLNSSEERLVCASLDDKVIRGFRTGAGTLNRTMFLTFEKKMPLILVGGKALNKQIGEALAHAVKDEVEEARKAIGGDEVVHKSRRKIKGPNPLSRMKKKLKSPTDGSAKKNRIRSKVMHKNSTVLSSSCKCAISKYSHHRNCERETCE